MTPFSRALDEYASACRMQGYATSGVERQSHVESAIKARQRVEALYAEVAALRVALIDLLDEVTEAGFRTARDYKWKERIAAADAALEPPK